MRRDGQGVEHAGDLVPAAEAPALRFIPDDDVGKHQPRHVEALAGGHAGDEPGVIRHDLAEGDVTQALAEDVAVDFVGDQPEIVLSHDVRHAAQLLLRPDPPGGVVGVAPEQHLHPGVGALLLQVVKVDGEVAAGVDEIGAQNRHVVVFRRVQEVAVGGRGDDEGLVLPDQIFHNLIQRGDDAGGKAELLPGEAPAVAAPAPAVQGLVIGVVKHHGIAEDAAVDPLPDGVADFRAAGKLHIRHPHAHEFLVPVREHLLRARMEDVAAEAVGVQGVGMAPVNDFIEIVFHVGSSFDKTGDGSLSYLCPIFVLSLLI